MNAGMDSSCVNMSSDSKSVPQVSTRLVGILVPVKFVVEKVSTNGTAVNNKNKRKISEGPESSSHDLDVKKCISTQGVNSQNDVKTALAHPKKPETATKQGMSQQSVGLPQSVEEHSGTSGSRTVKENGAKPENSQGTAMPRSSCQSQPFPVPFKDFAAKSIAESQKVNKSESYLCSVCNASFNTEPKLAQHARDHIKKQCFPCQWCDALFLHNSTLLRHMYIHTGKKRFQCTQCDASYHKRSSLNKHMRVHTGEKSVCKECGDELSSASTLRCHMRIHTGEKPFQCDCGAAFRDHSQLSRHKKIHLEEKPFACQECGFSFRYKHTLKKHKCRKEKEVSAKKRRCKRKKELSSKQSTIIVAEEKEEGNWTATIS